MTHSRTLTVLGASVLALAVAVGYSSSASAGSHSIKTTHRGGATYSMSPAKKGNCYSSLQNDTGIGIVLQNFEPTYDVYDSAAADNFDTKKTCNTTGVYVPGVYFNGSGPAVSETVTFYKDNGGEPGSVIDSQTVTGVDNGTGTFTIPLVPVALPPGMKWVSVVANMDFAAGGEWGWEQTSNIKQGSEGQWENPGNGFSTGCTSWGDVSSCVGYPGDFMVTILKG